jgi:hypothetical protein
MMVHLTTIEKNKYSPRPHFTRQKRHAIGWKPRPQQEAEALDTLKPVGIVEIEY